MNRGRIRRSHLWWTLLLAALIAVPFLVTTGNGPVRAAAPPPPGGQMTMEGQIPAAAYRRTAQPLDRTHWRVTEMASHAALGARDITVDIGDREPVGALLFTPSSPDRAGALGAFQVRTSRDGTHWSGLAAHGRLPDASGTQTVEILPQTTRFVRLTAIPRAGYHGTAVRASELSLLGAEAAPPSGTVVLPRDGWTATASSEETAKEHDPASNVLDGNRNTFWHSRYSSGTPALPQSITIDMGRVLPVSALTYYARPGNSPNGAVAGYAVTTSTDGRTFGAPVATGTWRDYSDLRGTHKTAAFDSTVTARYVKLVVNSSANGRPLASAAEIDLSGPADPATQGSWGSPIGMPTLPVSSSLLPNNTLLSWSAFAKDNFDSLPQHAYTATSVLNLADGTTSDSTVSNTGHQMFCVGIAALADGRLMVTGGSDDTKVSIFDPATGAWSKGPEMNVARGYQAMTPLANGDAFVLGGSWGNANNDLDKDGEVWDHTTNRWRLLQGVSADTMSTDDKQGRYRADNHMWLFQASNGKIFQAGPSKEMHWITPGSIGSVTDAGPRGTSGDTMVGNAVMYDVDKILTYGGGPNYNEGVATNRAFRVSLAGGNASVAEAAPLRFARSFSNGVALPDGQVLALGGQSFSEPFSDMDSVLTPELYNPATNTWTSMASSAVPRNYHSVANLLPDGRVFSGGGGLCGPGCVTNHFNGQIFSPPYLFNADGSAKTRPVITAAPATVAAGDTMSVTTSGAVSGLVLMRVGAATHGVDNDQRRVPVTATTQGGGRYTVAVPENQIAVPGEYMLFAMGSNGAPSMAKMLKVSE